MTESLLTTMDSDREAYEFCLAGAAAHIASAPSCQQVRDGIWTAEQAARFNLADEIKDYVWTITDYAGAGFPETAKCILMTLHAQALSLIDWHEVADHYIGKVREQRETSAAR